MEAAIPYEPHRDDHATVSSLPLLLEVPLDCGPYFRPFHDTSCDEVNKTPSTTVDGKAHGSGDDEAVRDLSTFGRGGWDPMGYDFSDHIDLSLYMHFDTSCNAALMKRTSRL